MIILLFGVLDEAHQFFVKGRDASLMDLGLDFIGGFFGIFIYRIKNTKEKSLTNKWGKNGSENKGKRIYY